MDEIAKRKKELLDSSELHKRAMSQDLRVLSTKAEKIATNGLITVGVLMSAVVVFKLLYGGGGSEKSSSNSGRLMRVIKQQIWIYILNEGRKRLIEYINGLDEKES